MILTFTVSARGRQISLTNQVSPKYAQLRGVGSMRATVRAQPTRDLAAFGQVLRDYGEELSSDQIRPHNVIAPRCAI
jgi:hypothetical protein